MDNKKIKVFLVDDHNILRSGLKIIIDNQKNMEVIGEAPDAKTALQQLKSLTPDIVLMDISMPGLNGIDATLEIKGLYPSVKVLILTMHDDKQLLFESVKVGGSGYILKGTSPDVLLAAINDVYEDKPFITPHIKDKLLIDYQDQMNNNKIKKDKYEILSKREKEILDMIARRFTSKQIAKEFNVTLKTIEAHRSNIILKLQITDRIELINYAKRKHMLTSC